MSKGLLAKSVEHRANGIKLYALFSNLPNPPLIKGGEGGLLLYAFCFLLFALCSLLFTSSSEAKVIGVCSNCHTMHNSQNGSAVVAEGPQSCLLNRAGCLGCHSSTSGTTWKDSVNGAPIVLNTVEPIYGAKGLAGGNFYYVSTTVDNTGHNVIAGNQEGNASMFPPPGNQHLAAGEIIAANFTCSGSKGCHGDRAVGDKLLSLKGAHHTDDSVLKFGSINVSNQGSSPGLSYRFLKGVYGGEDSDWQASSSSTDHNEYFGATSMGASSATAPANNTISGLCAECHGYFHGTTPSECSGASPWLRHPTDISLPSSGEYTAYTAYSLTAPVARTSDWAGWSGGGSASGTVSPSDTTDDIVMCLSCHRAHASPYFKMMRWDYKGWPGSGGTNGCNVCHTSKN